MENFCQGCGQKISAGQKFCGDCGEKFITDQDKPKKLNWKQEINVWSNFFLLLGALIFLILFIISKIK